MNKIFFGQLRAIEMEVGSKLTRIWISYNWPIWPFSFLSSIYSRGAGTRSRKRAWHSPCSGTTSVQSSWPCSPCFSF
jgi:hypothetical protein